MECSEGMNCIQQKVLMKKVLKGLTLPSLRAARRGKGGSVELLGSRVLTGFGARSDGIVDTDTHTVLYRCLTF